MIGRGSQACAVTGAPSSNAPTVEWIAVCTNRPAIAMTGPSAQSTVISRARLRAASAAAIGLPSAPSAAISASPGGFSWSKPSAVRSMTSSQSSRLTVTVSVTRDFSGRFCGPDVLNVRTCGPSPRSTATMVGCAGTDDRLGVSRSPVTSVGRGRVRVSVGGVLCCTTRCGAVHAVVGSPSVAAYAEPRTSTRSESPRARVVSGSAIRSASLGPGRARTHTVGSVETGWGTVSVRLNVTDVSGVSAIEAAHCVVAGSPGPSAQPGRPSSSEPRSHRATAAFGGGVGTSAGWGKSTGCANPEASYWVIDKSVIANCTPAEPSSVAIAVIRTHGVSPYGSAAVIGLPASSNLSVVVPLAVATSNLRTCAPTAVALGVMVMTLLVTGWSKSTCSHWPTADCSPLDTHAVAESPSIAAAGEVAGATSGSAVASDDELDAVSRPPVHAPYTVSAPGAG